LSYSYCPITFQNTASDKEIVNRVEEEMKKVVSNISDSGCHDNTDAAALCNQLAKKDRELTAKVNKDGFIF